MAAWSLGQFYIFFCNSYWCILKYLRSKTTFRIPTLYSITVWCAACLAVDRTVLQGVIRSGENGWPLPSLETIASSLCLCRAQLTRPIQLILFWNFCHQGECFKSFKSSTNKLKNSFYPWAVGTLNPSLCNSLKHWKCMYYIV